MPEYLFSSTTTSVKCITIDDALSLSHPDEEKNAELKKNTGNMQAFSLHFEAVNKKYNGFFVRPKRSKGRLPVIIYNRGGVGDVGKVTAVQLYSGLIAKLVTAGYAVIGSQYMELDNDGGTRDEVGGHDLNSTLTLYDMIATEPTLDKERIGIFGVSRGGSATFQVLTHKLNIKAAVIFSGLIDCTDKTFRPELIKYYTKFFNPTAQELEKRSVLYWVDKLPKTVPILLLAGTADWRTDPLKTLDLAKKFQEQNVPYRLIMYEGADHYLTEFKTEAYEQILTWFDRFLCKKEPSPDTKPHGK